MAKLLKILKNNKDSDKNITLNGVRLKLILCVTLQNSLNTSQI